MTKSLTVFKTLTDLANALDKRNVKAITPDGLRNLAKTTLKDYDKLGEQTKN
jgi:hypothetical protein